MRFIFTLLKARLKDRKRALFLIFLSTLASSALLAVVGGTFMLAGSKVKKTVAEVIGPLDRVVVSGTLTDWEADKTRYGLIAPPPALPKEVVELTQASSVVNSALLLAYARVEILDPKQKFSGSMYRPGHTVTLPIYAVKGDELPPEYLLPGVTDAQWKNSLARGEVILPELPNFGRGDSVRYPAGSEILVSSHAHQSKWRVGTTYPTKGRVRDFGGVFVSEKMFETLLNRAPVVNRIFVDLDNTRPDSETQFDEAFNATASAAGLPSSMLTQADYIEDQGVAMGGGFGLLPFSGTILTLIGTFFIIVFAVGIGNRAQINESLGLRALGVPSGKLAWVIILETLIPALLGCLMGLILARICYQMGIQTGRGGLSFGDGNELATNIYNQVLWAMAPVALVVTLISSLVAVTPVVLRMVRKHPLEARAEVKVESTELGTWRMGRLCGALVLVAINPWVAGTTVCPDLVKYVLVPVTYLTTLLGLLMLIQPISAICRQILFRPLAWIIGIDQRLVLNFLLIHRSKMAIGTATMVVGLGLFVATYIWGDSMKTPFILTEQTPDVSAVLFPDGIAKNFLKKDVISADFEAFVPLHLQHPTLSDQQAANSKLVGGNWRDLILIGTENMHEVFGEKGIMAGELIAGDDETFNRVNRGEGVVITAELYRSNPELYAVGQTIEIQKIDDHSVHSQTIVGIIDMPGWHMFTKSARMRRGLGRLAALVFASETLTQRIYPASKPRCFWINVAPEAVARVTEKSSKSAERRPIQASSKSPEKGQNGESNRRLVQGRRGPSPTAPTVQVVESYFDQLVGAEAGKYLRVVDTHEMNDLIKGRSNSVIAGLAKVPFLVLILSAIAMAATASASIYARAHEIGVFRSIGISNSQLLRLLLVENLVVTLGAILLGLAFGLLVAWSGIQVSALGWGIAPPFVVPGTVLLEGALISAAAGLIGAVIPSYLAARKSALKLIQELEEQ